MAPIVARSDQGTAYSLLVAQELTALRERRTASVDRLGRIQQSAALPVAVVAAAGSLVQGAAAKWHMSLLVLGTVCLVMAVVVAAIGLQQNRSRLAEPQGLKEFVRAGWTDDEVDARYNVSLHQIEQMRDLDRVCENLYGWALWATWTQAVGLVLVGVGGVSLLISS